MRENVCGVCDVNITRGKMFSFIYTVVLVVQEKKRKKKKKKRGCICICGIPSRKSIRRRKENKQ
jgi:hypothetical protein